MTIPTLTKIAGKQAAAAAKGLEFSPQALALLVEGETAQAWLEKLEQSALHEDAIKLLAGALPKRDCVHWALVCSREATAKDGTAAQRAALDATALWEKDPSDANRRAAGMASEKAQLDNTAGCTALAAFMSGGSLAPAELTPVPPPEHLCALSAGVAIQLAAQMDGPVQVPNHLRRLFGLGLKLAAEKAPWDPPAGAPKPG